MNRPVPKPGRFGDLGPRVSSALVIAFGAFALLWLGGFWVTVLAAIVLALALWEYHRMITGAESLSATVLHVLVSGSLAALFLASEDFFLLALACLIGSSAMAGILSGRFTAWISGGAIYIGLGIGTLHFVATGQPDGFSAIVWLTLVVIAADVGAYFTGRSFGGPKLWPSVSPGKTWSGALGGLLLACVISLTVSIIAGWNPVRALLLAIPVAVGSQLGDLLESAVKRRTGVKDSSGLIPGHGGVLDRLDGILGGAWVYLVFLLLDFGVNGP